MIKVIHIADLHLGMKPDYEYSWGEEREREIYQSVKNIIGVCNQEKVDFLLIAGDLFHHIPKEKQLQELSKEFELLQDTRVVIIEGSYNYLEGSSLIHTYSWPKNIVWLSTNKGQYYYAQDKNAYIYPYNVQPLDYLSDRVDKDKAAASYFKPLEDLVNQCKVQTAKEDSHHILLAYGGTQSNEEMLVSHLENIGFDYVALGGRHTPKRIAENMAYAGSLEPLNPMEMGEHGFILGTFECNRAQVQFVDFCCRKYEEISVFLKTTMNMEQVMEVIKQEIARRGVEHIYKVVIEGDANPEFVLDLELIHRLGNIIEVDDQTIPFYEYEQIYEQNKSNIIGTYMEGLYPADEQEEHARLVLYYGIKALMKSKE